MDVRLPDGTVVKGIPDGISKAELTSKLVANGYGASLSSAEDRAMADPTRGNSFLQNATIGLGKMMTDTGRGVAQLFGAGNQEAIDEAKKLDAPLMNTVGGNVGHIAGNVGMALLPGGALSAAGRFAGAPALSATGRYLLQSPVTLGGAAVGAGMGAVQGGIQPVASDESRSGNMLIGGIGGSAVPLMGMGAGALKGAVEPLYEGGREAIIGRALNAAAGANAPVARANLAAGGQLVPGSLPTAAEVAGSPGIAAMQRAASAVDPEAYGQRAIQNNQARVAALDQMAGTEADRSMQRGVRSMMTEIPYQDALSSPIDKGVSQAMKPQIESLMRRPAMQSAVNKAKEIFAEEDIALIKSGSPRGLQLAKQALDDLIEKAGSPASSIGKNQLKALQQTRSDLVSTMETLTPKLRDADRAYAQWSQPINQMDVAQNIRETSLNPLTGMLQPQQFARTLSNDPTARATGRAGATLENVMSPGQLGILQSIQDDMARQVFSQNAGRGAGSDTVQKLAMTNLMQQSGLPVGILNFPGVGRIGNWAYNNADEAMRRSLSDTLLNPQATAGVMGGALPNQALLDLLQRSRMIAAPGILGATTSLQGR